MRKIEKHERRDGTAAAADYAGGNGLVRAARLRRDNNEAHCRTGPCERGNHFCHFPRTEDLYWGIVEDKVSSDPSRTEGLEKRLETNRHDRQAQLFPPQALGKLAAKMVLEARNV